MEASFNSRPWRFRHPSKQQKVTLRKAFLQRDVKNEDRPGYIYENTWPHDKLSCKMSKICTDLKPILQKLPPCEGQFAMNGDRGAPFLAEICRGSEILRQRQRLAPPRGPIAIVRSRG
jgi:hypothetical protein